MSDEARYRAYMLRGWLEEAGGGDAQDAWRFRLQDVATGQQWAFKELGGITSFLERQFDQEDDAG